MKSVYKTPGKAILWGMAVGQWMVIFIFGALILGVIIAAHWKALCDFCQHELNKANEDLVKVLKRESKVQNLK